MRQKMLKKTKKEQSAKPVKITPTLLDWFSENGIDLRLHLTVVNGHVRKAKGVEKVLGRKSLKRAEAEMDKYLNSYRSASSKIMKIVGSLSDPAIRKKFLAENKRITAKRYDAMLESLKKRSSRYERLALKYEKAYEKKYRRKRPVYERIHLVRSIARETRISINKRQRRAKKETDELIAAFSQDLQKRIKERQKPIKYRDRTNKRKVRIKIEPSKPIVLARAARPNEYRRGYERGAIIAPRRPRAPAGTRVAVGKSKAPAGTRIAMNKPKGPAGSSLVKKGKGPKTLAQLRASIIKLKAQRIKEKQRIASLSGKQKKIKETELTELTREINRLRRMRERKLGRLV